MPAKRKKPNKQSDVFTTTLAIEKSTDKSPTVTNVIEENPDPDDRMQRIFRLENWLCFCVQWMNLFVSLSDVAVEFPKQEDCNLSEYGDDKPYHTNDETESELYETTSQPDGKYIKNMMSAKLWIFVNFDFFFLFVSAAADDKPNIATQAELGTWINLFFVWLSPVTKQTLLTDEVNFIY